MKRLTAVLFVFLFCNCGGSSDENQSNETEAKKEKKSVEGETPGKRREHEEKKGTKKNIEESLVSIKGTGLLPEGGKVRVDLSIDDKGIVKGTIDGKTGKFTVSGIRRNNSIRCWVTGRDDIDGKIWRGILNGKAENGENYAGNLTISDSAARNVIRADWKSES